jgi:hypothetical protein
MDRFNKQKDFSKLYKQLNNYLIPKDLDISKNPFSFFKSFYLPKGIPLRKYGFDESLMYQNEILNSTKDAYNCFLLEFNFLEYNKEKYINVIIDFLYKEYEVSRNKDNPIVCYSIRNLFSKICNSEFNNLINSKNRNRLSKWYNLKEPIKSFTFKKRYEDKWLDNRIFYPMRETFSREGFLSMDTSFSSFKALFDEKYLENKINWTDNKSSLIYFIKSLIKEKVIESPKNKHWEIVSEFFLINGETILQEELLNQKETKNPQKRKLINSIISKLLNYNYS